VEKVEGNVEIRRLQLIEHRKTCNDESAKLAPLKDDSGQNIPEFVYQNWCGAKSDQHCLKTEINKLFAEFRKDCGDVKPAKVRKNMSLAETSNNDDAPSTSKCASTTINCTQ